MTQLFVYGTLKQGCKWHQQLAGQTFLGEARTQAGYTLYSLDGYPGLAPLADDQEGVTGELWAVDPACLRRLDAFEGVHENLYRREQIPLNPPWNQADAYVYARPLELRKKLGSTWSEA